MAYTQDRLVEAQNKLKNYVQGADQRIAGMETQARDLLASRSAGQSGTSDILGEFGSKYGISGLQEAGADVQTTIDPRIARGQEQAITMMKQKALSEKYSQLFNYALDQYQAAGYNLDQSNAFARQWAQDQVKMQDQADASARERDFVTKKQGISDEYANKMSDAKMSAMDEEDPYQAAAIRAGLNVAGQVGTYQLLKRREDQRYADMLKKLQARRATIPQTSSPGMAGVGSGYEDVYDTYYGGGINASGNRGRIAGS